MFQRCELEVVQDQSKEMSSQLTVSWLGSRLEPSDSSRHHLVQLALRACLEQGAKSGGNSLLGIWTVIIDQPGSKREEEELSVLFNSLSPNSGHKHLQALGSSHPA